MNLGGLTLDGVKRRSGCRAPDLDRLGTDGGRGLVASILREGQAIGCRWSGSIDGKHHQVGRSILKKEIMPTGGRKDYLSRVTRGDG